MKFYAVIDTNVIVSALLSKKEDAATVKILKELAGGRIIPLYHSDILAEYNEVLHRDKFPLTKETVDNILRIIQQFGMELEPTQTDEEFLDQDDRIFYEVAMTKREAGSYLITGNKRHYPQKFYVVSPSEMLSIMEEAENNIATE